MNTWHVNRSNRRHHAGEICQRMWPWKFFTLPDDRDGKSFGKTLQRFTDLFRIKLAFLQRDAGTADETGRLDGDLTLGNQIL